MGRLLLLLLVVGAAWYGWNKQDVWRDRGTHEIIALNRSGRAVERLRIHIGGQTFAMEAIENGASGKLPLRCEHDGVFRLEWLVRGIDGEKHWQGGGFTAGPVLMRHRFEFTSGYGVIWSSELKPERRGRRGGRGD